MLDKPIRKCKSKISLVFLCLLILLPMLSHAQVLEEIIVTSQKRAESLQDVSVSVTALSGEKLADGAIARLEEVTAFVPNFTLSETGIGTNIYIRGIGSGTAKWNMAAERSYRLRTTVSKYQWHVIYGKRGTKLMWLEAETMRLTQLQPKLPD